MTVAELITKLQTCPQDALVVCQKDAEGNGYSPCAGADPGCVYVAECEYAGVVYSDTDCDIPEDAVPCITLYPIN